MQYNFNIVNADTDSISICKNDQRLFSLDEQTKIVEEINNIYPKKIRWAHDGYFSCIVCLRSKNYILWDGKKLKIKGSALRDSKTEKILKELKEEIIWIIIKAENYLSEDSLNKYKEIYNKYIKEASNIKDISKWCKKVTISEKVLNNDRTNEVKIQEVIKNTDYAEGDKIYIYYKTDDSLELLENYNNDYNIERMYKKLYNTIQVFENILNVKELFLNYSLKRNKKLLESLLNK